MTVSHRQTCLLGMLVLGICGSCGCSSMMYQTVVRPVPRLSLLSPELQNLTDDVIETYLTADVRPVFPTVLAIAKLRSAGWHGDQQGALELTSIRGAEAEGWRKMVGPTDPGSAILLEQVQFISPMLTSGRPTIKSLRDGAALLHAPLLLVYMQQDNSSEGYNPAAMAYWTIIGLFVVPGNTVGHSSACQAVLIDTRSGFILATADGESLKEENVLAGAVPIATDRTRQQARTAAVAALQENFRGALIGLALTRGVADR